MNKKPIQFLNSLSCIGLVVKKDSNYIINCESDTISFKILVAIKEFLNASDVKIISSSKDNPVS